ncbi:MAG: hypothetical protein AAFW00_16040 [Bacteroidota bacterium]
MSRYKINIDQPLPDPQVMRKHKDFDSLYDAYRVNSKFEFWRNIYKNPRFFGIFVILAAVGFLVFDSVQEEEARAEVVWFQPPFDPLQPAYQVMPIDTEAMMTRFTEADFQLKIPEDAFVEAPNEEIELRYRYLPDARSWFLVDLPMQNDTGFYRSPGIVEIQAWAGDRPATLKPEVKIEVSYTLPQRPEGYNASRLDTTEMDWKPLGVVPVNPVADTQGLLALGPKPGYEVVQAEMVAKSAASPSLKRPGRPFGVKLKNMQDFPDFRPYQQIFWEYIPGAGSSNPWEERLIGPDQGWNDVRARKMDDDRYQLTFTKTLEDGGLMRRRVMAKPIKGVQSENQAQNWYAQQQAAYAQAVADWEAARNAAVAAESTDQEATVRARIAQWVADSIYLSQPTAYQVVITTDKLGFIGLTKEERMTTKPVEVFLPDSLTKDGADFIWLSNDKMDQLLVQNVRGASIAIANGIEAQNLRVWRKEGKGKFVWEFQWEGESVQVEQQSIEWFHLTDDE